MQVAFTASRACDSAVLPSTSFQFVVSGIGHKAAGFLHTPLW